MFAAELAKNKLTKIELHVHTSGRKSHRFNILLAEKRASALKGIFEKYEMPTDQAQVFALGESNPLNPCKRCSEEEHAANSRVVLVVKEGELYLDQ
jgi:outer membrane protein OmpA-like peptidoglycan-associated protein